MQRERHGSAHRKESVCEDTVASWVGFLLRVWSSTAVNYKSRRPAATRREAPDRHPATETHTEGEGGEREQKQKEGQHAWGEIL